MDLISANINNMTNLWKLGGERCGHYYEEDAYALSVVSNSEWPNKLWFKEPITEQQWYQIEHCWNLDLVNVSLWGLALPLSKILPIRGFELKNTLTGMSLDLEQFQPVPSKLELMAVQHLSDAIQWSELFHLALGYRIPAYVVERTMSNVKYFIVKGAGEWVGTAILYMDQPHIVGIHSVGVIPSQRRRGFAGGIMHDLLHLAKAKGAKYATLQASEMGRGLYHQLGFQDDFLIKTYFKH